MNGAKSPPAWRRIDSRPQLRRLTEQRFLLTVAEAIVRAAFMRPESRGAHWRLDFLEKDPGWGRQNIIARKEGETMQITTRPRPELPPEFARLFEGEPAASPASHPA